MLERSNPGLVDACHLLTSPPFRAFAWIGRTSADVINRGYSGYNTAMLRADLSSILGPLRRQDVVAVTLMIGANDCVATGQPTHVPLASYHENMDTILGELKSALPNAKLVVLGPLPLNEGKWQETAKRLSGGKKDGKDRSVARHIEYNKAAGEAASKAGAKFLDLIYKLKYEMANAMMELQNPHHDGLHMTQAVNIFVYRKLKSLLDELDLNPSKMPRHWPKSLIAAYPHFADDDGHQKKYIPKNQPKTINVTVA